MVQILRTARGVCLLLLSFAPAARADETLAGADKLRLTGRYDEAVRAYQQNLEKEPVAAVVGLSRTLQAQGKYAEAVTTLTAASEKQPAAAALPAELALLALQRGDHAAAQKLAEAALKLDQKQLAARLVAAELHR